LRPRRSPSAPKGVLTQAIARGLAALAAKAFRGDLLLENAPLALRREPRAMGS
jgi:hypothetical protein